MITEPDGISETYLLEVQSSCKKLIGSQGGERGEKMHQIYSCSDENLEVFTVISPKSCNPIRRKTKGTQCILSKKVQNKKKDQEKNAKRHHIIYILRAVVNVVAVSSYQPQGTDELLSHPGDLIQVFYKNKDGQDFSHLQSRQKGFFSNPTKCPETRTEMFSCGNNQLDVKSVQPQVSSGSHRNANWIAAPEPAVRDGVAEQHAVLSCKSTEDDTGLTHGTEASLPLTGNTLQGTPSLLRKIWMKHKKKAEYLGATNGAFEAD